MWRMARKMAVKFLSKQSPVQPRSQGQLRDPGNEVVTSRLRIVPLSLSPSRETRKKTARNKGQEDSLIKWAYLLGFRKLSGFGAS